jgi:hypothetical protein
MEMLEAQVVFASGDEAGLEGARGLAKVVVGLLTSAEETFEMLGVAVFVYALLGYIGSCVGDISVRVRIDQ